MKKQLVFVLLATATVFAEIPEFLKPFASIRPGLDLQGGYDLLLLGEDVKDGTAKTSYGFGGGLSLSYPLSDNFSVVGEALYLHDQYVYSDKTDTTYKVESTFKADRLGFRFAPRYKFGKRFGVELGYQYELPISGTAEAKESFRTGPTTWKDTTIKLDLKSAPQNDRDNVDANGVPKQVPVLSTHNLLVGVSFYPTPWLSTSLEAKFGLNGMVADYTANGELRGSAREFVADQFGLSVKVELP